jgi:hypothetical protein
VAGKNRSMVIKKIAIEHSGDLISSCGFFPFVLIRNVQSRQLSITHSLEVLHATVNHPLESVFLAVIKFP